MEICFPAAKKKRVVPGFIMCFSINFNPNDTVYVLASQNNELIYLTHFIELWVSICKLYGMINCEKCSVFIKLKNNANFCLNGASGGHGYLSEWEKCLNVEYKLKQSNLCFL